MIYPVRANLQHRRARRRRRQRYPLKLISNPGTPTREGGGPNPPYGEDLFQRVVGVHWPKKVPPTVLTGAYIVVLGSGTGSNLATPDLLAVSTDGMNWNFWLPPFNLALWTLTGAPTGSGGLVLMVAGADESTDIEQAVLFLSTDLGRSWFNDTPFINGDQGAGTEIDGSGGSYRSKTLVATTWAGPPPGAGNGNLVVNSIMLNSGGGWDLVASAPDPPDGGYEFPDPPIPPDTICYNTAGGGFHEFPPTFYDPLGDQGCPYVGPDGSRGIYFGPDTAIGPPGILTGGPPFTLQVVGQEAGTWKTVDVDALNATGLLNNDMFFVSNFPLP